MMRSTSWIACLAVILAFTAPGVHAQAEARRLALVIGVSAYDPLARLDNALADAEQVAEVLEDDADFEVTRIIDPIMTTMRAQVADFVAGVRQGDVVVIYYAGHGVQVNGRNWLLPGDFPDDATQLETRALAADELLRMIGMGSPAMKLLILDACRNSPLSGVSSNGLAAMEPATFGAGTRIEFAASAGQAAQDGVFAKHLVAELTKPGQDLDAVFRNVRAQVAQATGGMQTTMSASQLTINFYFIPADLPSPGDALAELERIAAQKPRADMGQKAALEALVGTGRSFSGTDLLEGISFADARLAGADLSRARLDGTALDGANLATANLKRASLVLATLPRADLAGAALDSAVLAFAIADSTELRDATLAGSAWFAARARSASFVGANLHGAGFMFADLRDADFSGADLTGALFVGSDLRGARFDGATLAGTDLTGSLLDASALSGQQRGGACRMDVPAVPEGAFGYVLDVVVIEPIENARFSGGVEYSRFSETQHLFRLPASELPPCGRRRVVDTGWHPVWQNAGQDNLRTDVSFRLSHALLEQAGRRREVRERIQAQLDHAYPFPTGVWTANVEAPQAPDLRDLGGSWSLEFRPDGVLRLDAINKAPLDVGYEVQPRYRVLVLPGDGVLACDGRTAEYRWNYSPEGNLRLFSYPEDPCTARLTLLTRDWRPERRR